MDASFWHERWQTNQIGFHKSEVNPILLRHASRLSPMKGQSVFVPLCGKTKDLVWWRDQGLKVTGVELSPIACDDFFREEQIGHAKNHHHYQSESIELFQQDIFAFESLKGFDFIYDRAATIALPESMRPRYIEKIKSLMGPATKLLLLTIEYEQDKVSGPPFNVSEAEVRQAYSGMQIELLEEKSGPLDNPRFQNLEVSEKVFLISPLS